MTQAVFVDTAKVMAKGQVTIPKDVRAHLGIQTGDKLSFIVEGDQVRVVNSAIYGLRMMQAELAGMAKNAQLDSDEAIEMMIAQMRQ